MGWERRAIECYNQEGIDIIFFQMTKCLSNKVLRAQHDPWQQEPGPYVLILPHKTAGPTEGSDRSGEESFGAACTSQTCPEW